MDIKKIVKRNLKNMGSVVKDVLRIPVKLISVPWGYILYKVDDDGYRLLGKAKNPVDLLRRYK